MVVDFRPGTITFPDSELELEVVDIRGTWGPQNPGAQADLSDTEAVVRFEATGGGVSQAADTVPGAYAYAQNFVTRFPGYGMPSGELTEVIVNIAGVTLGEITGSFEQDGHLYLLCGRYIVPISSGTAAGPITALGSEGLDLGVGASCDGAALFGDAAYVGMAEAAKDMRKKASGGSWSTLTDIRRRKPVKTFWKVDDAATDTYAANYQLIALDGDDSRAYRHVSADPADAGNWSAAIPVLNRTYPVNALVGSNRHVWFATAGSVVDTDDRNEPLPLNEHTFSKPYHATLNGADAIYREGFLYVCHVRGLVRIDVRNGTVRSDADQFCGPGTGLSNETPVYPKNGRHGLFEMDSWLGYWCHNGTDSYVNFGKPREELGVGGYGPLGWFLGEYYLPNERVTHCRYSAPSGVNPRLWITSVDALGAVRIRWASQPYALSPLQELLNEVQSITGAYIGSHRFAPSWKFVMSKLDFNRQNARKAAWRVDLRADRLGAANEIAVHGGMEDRLVSLLGSVATSPRGSVLPSDPLDVGHNLQYELRGTNTPTSPIVLREIRVGAELIEERRYSKTYTVRLANYASRRNGSFSFDDQQAIYNLLVTLRGRPLRFIDDENTLRRVIVQDDLQDKPMMLDQDGAATKVRERVAVFTVSRLPVDVSELNLDAAPVPPEDSRQIWGNTNIWGDAHLWGT